jgi:cell division ATPase FtsA
VIIARNMLPVLPDSANNQRAQYQHRARKIAETPRQRAAKYFTDTVDPVISDLLASIASARPEDVVSHVFAWSRRKLTERQLTKKAPDVVVSTGGVQTRPGVTIGGGAEMDAAAAKLQAVQRGRAAKKVVQTKKQEKSAATKMQSIERGRQSRRKSAALSGSKAKKMGSLLLKAQKEGNLEAAVENMEAAGVE